MENENEGDSTATTVVEETTDPVVTNEFDLASMLNAPAPVDTPAEEVEKVSEVKEVEAKENQPTPEVAAETEGSEEVKTEEEVEDQPEDAENVLSKNQKTINKLRKRVDKTTKNWKTAEEQSESKDEEIANLQGRLAKLESGKTSEGEANFAERTESAESVDNLQELYDSAKAARKWARKHQNEDSVEVNGVEFDREQILALLNDSEEAIETHIPQKMEKFNQRAQVDELALKDFDFLKDDKSEGYKVAMTVMNKDAETNKFFSKSAYGMYLLGATVLGIQTRDDAAKAAEVPEEEVKAPKAPKIAPQVPGLSPTVTPPRMGSDEKKNASLKAITQKSKVTQDELATLLAAAS